MKDKLKNLEFDMQKGEATRERIKEASLGLFHLRGYKNTSINHVLDSSGIKKGTFYFHFPSKETLAVEVLEKAIADYNLRINDAIISSQPAEQIKDMINSIVAYHVDDKTKKGCLFGNMALEMGKNGTDVAELVEKVFDLWVKRFEELLKRGIDNQEIELKESPQAFSRTILALIEGGIMLSKSSGDPEALIDCQQSIYTMIDERKI